MSTTATPFPVPERSRAPVVLITGAAGQLGSAIARAVAVRGARLVVHDQNEDSLLLLAGEVGAAPVLGDLTIAGEARRMVEEVLNLHGRIDGVVNNAGIEGSIGPIEELSLADVRRVFEVNVIGMVAVLQAALPAMRAQRKGRVVNIASGAGTAGSAWMAPYSASKHAVIGLTRSIALEVANVGITVNAVCPGIIESPMIDRIAARFAAIEGTDEPFSFVSSIPIGRYVAPDEVASVVSWLLLDAPPSITGSCEVVDGGMRA